MKKIKRILSLVLCFLFAFAIGSGCGNKQTEQSDDWTESVTGEKQVVLKFTHIWSEHAKTFTKICDDFTALYPNVRIQTNVKTYANIDTAISSSWGSSLFPDICFYWAHSVSTLVNDEVTMAADLTDVFYEKYKEDFIGEGKCMSSYAKGGKIYVVPFRATGFVIYYNADLFAELGISVPTNLEEFEVAMKTIKEECEDVVPLSCWGATGTYSYIGSALSAYMDILSGKADDPNYKTGRLVNTEEDFDRGALVYEKVRQWTKAGYFGSNPLAGSTESVESDFINGKCAMAMLNNNSLAAIQSEMDVNVGCFSLPGFSAMDNPQAGYVSGGYDGFFISKSSKNKAWALKFLEYLNSYEVQQLFADNEGSVMSRNDIVYRNELQQNVAASMANVGLLGTNPDFVLSEAAAASSIALNNYTVSKKGSVDEAKEKLKTCYNDLVTSVTDSMLNYPPLTMIEPIYTVNENALSKYLEWLGK
ncbi:MAG: ABC transporter substrate-binding protein [Candidatus Borkfalkiaceae bacterium]|nr:ABC transporter substrate-binding protein [Christensenellaceae bacterium]